MSELQDITSVSPVTIVGRQDADIEVVWELADRRGVEIQQLRQRVADLAGENARLRERERRVIDLHTDSVAGVCPSCGRIGDQSFSDDGLVPWPCPTILALNPRAAAS